MKINYSKTSVLLSRAVLCFAVILFFSQCSVKKTIYFNDLPTDTLQVVKMASTFHEPIVQADDVLNISIHTLDPSTSQVVNQTMAVQAVGASTATSVGNQIISGFLVDKQGYIHMALLGDIKVAGLTTFAVRELITERAKKYFKDPNVQVRFANFKITVLGEVTRPATYTVPNEKISVLDALGLAGDLTIFGKRDNVLLIREQNGQNELIRLNLNNSDILASDYFYLRQNDVLYVEPGKGKAAVNNASRTQTFAMIGTFVSLLIVAFSRL